jgi:hypothetical protein
LKQSCVSGTSFQLHLNAVHTGSTYNWTGPNGWQSSDPEPEIPQALSSHAGKYSVEEITPYGCRIKATSDSVIVTQGTASCTPANNTATFSTAGIGNMSFSYVSGAPSGGSYFITANSMNGDLELEFPGTSKPVAGIYNVTPLGGDWKTGNVRVRLVAASSNWPASSGKVYFTLNSSNKFKAVFCSLPVYGQTWGVNSTASGQVSEQ